MSFADLSHKLTEIRARLLRQHAYGNFDALSLSTSIANTQAINIDKLNSLCDRVNNSQGDLSSLYLEACQYGVPEQKFMQVESKSKLSCNTAQVAEVQSALHKITLRPKKK
jgi:hypothetical protein